MLRRILLLPLALASIVPNACLADSGGAADAFATEQGTWVTIYLNDFQGMLYAGGLTKASACVSEARRKAGEFVGLDGLKVSTRLLTRDLAAFEVTGRDNYLIYCNSNSALVVDMLISGRAAEAMARRENDGTAAKANEPKPATTKTDIDLTTGKATSTTTVPSN